MTLENDAQMICQTLHNLGLGLTIIPGDRIYPGLSLNGKNAIKEMKEDNYPYWKEMEWPAYYISYLLEKHLNNRFSTIKGKKRICFKADYLWDVRLKATGSHSTWVPLTDVRHIDEIFETESGFGLIIIYVIYKYDENGEFRSWHEKEKGGSSDYTKKIALEGRKPRRRKTDAFLINADAYYFPALEDFRAGIQNDWLDEDFARTMRNANEASRNPKYAINGKNIPKKFRIYYHNFNVDVEEFDEEFFLD